MDPYMQANRDLWNEWTPIHEKSELYDLAGFKAGKSSLKPIEIEEVETSPGNRCCTCNATLAKILCRGPGRAPR